MSTRQKVLFPTSTASALWWWPVFKGIALILQRRRKIESPFIFIFSSVKLSPLSARCLFVCHSVWTKLDESAFCPHCPNLFHCSVLCSSFAFSHSIPHTIPRASSSLKIMQLFLFYNRPLIVTRDCLQMRGLAQTVEHIMKDWLSNPPTTLPSSTHDRSLVLFSNVVRLVGNTNIEQDTSTWLMKNRLRVQHPGVKGGLWVVCFSAIVLLWVLYLL